MPAAPTGNGDGTAARAYHEATKHSLASVQRAPHFLDFANMPLPFKVYPQLAPLPLPRDVVTSSLPALEVIAGRGAAPGTGRALDLATLAHLLHFTAGVLRRRVHAGGTTFFRAQACTGNLHHIDLYLVCGPLPDLAAGVYHFSPHDFALRLLRAGDHRAVVVEATADEPAVRDAPVLLACTSTFWRNAWKYQARTWRHAFWDDGTLLANLLATTAALGIAARLVLGFVDEALNRLLDVDGEHEATLSLVAFGAPAPNVARGAPDPDARVAPALPSTLPVPPLGFETLPLSAHEVAYPAIVAAHHASSLASPAEVAAWRTRVTAAPPPPGTSGPGTIGPGTSGRAPLVPLLRSVPPQPEPIEAVILRRGSTRVFGREPIGFDHLSTIVSAVGRSLAADFLAPGASLVDLYLIVHAVDGLDAGSYVVDRARAGLIPLRSGNFRREAQHLDLGQPLAADAAVNLYWLADLSAVLARLGDRGYRAAQLEAAIAGGNAYLAAFALGFGATGLTFFDDDVTDFFAPDAAGKSVLFLMAIGRPARRAVSS
jgi:SagB-type dehydrogenase family enzyme